MAIAAVEALVPAEGAAAAGAGTTTAAGAEAGGVFSTARAYGGKALQQAGRTRVLPHGHGGGGEGEQMGGGDRLAAASSNYGAVLQGLQFG